MSEKKENPFRAYAVASQIAFNIICPLLLFIGGGHYAVNRFGWPDWVMGILVFVGIIVMICSVSVSIFQIIRLYGKDDKTKYKRSYNNPRDNDYYDDYKNLRK